MFKTSIAAEVLNVDDQVVDFELEFSKGAVTVYMDGEFVCGGDWHENLALFFEEALKMWPTLKSKSTKIG